MFPDVEGQSKIFPPCCVITDSVRSFREEVSVFIVPTIPCFPANFLLPLQMGEGADPEARLLWHDRRPCESALHQSLKLGTGSGRYRRIKPVLKSYNAQTEHFRGLSWALAMCGPHSYGTLSLAVPKQTQEAQTGSQCTPAGRYSVPSNKKDLLLSGWLLCAFQSAANKELDCVRPVQDGLNNTWKQTCFKNLPALGFFFQDANE